MGAYLRAARTEQRVSLERAAESTKIKADFLMRMESDEFDFIAPAYARGFLRTYARFLGLEEEPFLEEFDSRFGAKPVDTVQIVAADRAKTKKIREHSPFSRWTILLVIAAGVLLLLALIGIFAPKPSRDRDRGPAVAQTPTAEETRTPDKGKKKKDPNRSPEDERFDSFFADGIDLVVEATTAPCWVDIEADGEQVFAETLEAGQAESFKADEEMVIVLGAPSNVQVTLNDEIYEDLNTPDAGALSFTLPDDFGTVLPFPSPTPTVPGASPGEDVDTEFGEETPEG